MPNDKELLDAGEFLTEKEFKDLVDGIFKRMNRLIEIYNEKDYLTIKVNFIFLYNIYQNASKLQDCLITFLQFMSGGQRRQIPLNITLDDVKYNNRLKVYFLAPKLEKVPRKKSQIGILVPTWLGKY